MSLRDDFEKDYRLNWEADDVAWAAYQAATARALRIVREESATSSYRLADRVEQRIKGES